MPGERGAEDGGCCSSEGGGDDEGNCGGVSANAGAGGTIATEGVGGSGVRGGGEAVDEVLIDVTERLELKWVGTNDCWTGDVGETGFGETGVGDTPPFDGVGGHLAAILFDAAGVGLGEDMFELLLLLDTVS
jgi:hypothetical protein